MKLHKMGFLATVLAFGGVSPACAMPNEKRAYGSRPLLQRHGRLKTGKRYPNNNVRVKNPKQAAQINAMYEAWREKTFLAVVGA